MDTSQTAAYLSHGQASVERRFLVNKEVVAPNLKEMSLTSIRLVQKSYLKPHFSQQVDDS